MFSQSVLVVSVCLLSLVSCSSIQPELKVVNIEREVDLKTQIVHSTLNIELENAGQRVVKEYLVAFEPAISGRLSWIEASKTGGSKKQSLTVKPHQVAQWKDETKFFSVAFGEDLKPGSKLKLEVKTAFTHLPTPHPAQISQAEQQFVVFEGSAAVFSAQNVVKQRTVYHLPAGTVESYSKDASVGPVSQDGQTVTYGPYENIPAFSEKSVRIHYENNSPFLTVTQLDRLIEVSHWGNIAVEETVDVVHTGAKLKGSFSRYDFQRDPRANIPAVKTFKSMLPAAAADVYYRDEIGNISTSNLRNHEDSVELEIRPRFPLFGGWKTHYYIGYNLPSYEYLHRVGSRYVLQMRFVDHIFDDIVIDDAVVRVILPERVSDIKVWTPYETKRDMDTKLYTYLDYNGRTVVTLNKKNLIEAHIRDFQIEYRFEQQLMAIEPMMLVGVFYMLFLLAIVYARLDFSIAKDALSESRLKLAGLLERVRSTHEDRMSAYDTWQDAIDKTKTNRDAAPLMQAKKKLDADFKKWTADSAELAIQTKSESAEIAEKIQEIQRLDKQIRDQLTLWSTSAERLITGKANKQQYNDAEKAAKTKIDEWKAKTESMVYGL